jgi:hypothetical protein
LLQNKPANQGQQHQQSCDESPQRQDFPALQGINGGFLCKASPKGLAKNKRNQQAISKGFTAE